MDEQVQRDWDRCVEFHGHVCPRHLLEAPTEEHFDWREITFELPKGPKLNPTVQCAFCGEGVMEQRASVRDGRIACPECVENYESRVLVLNK